VEVNTMSKSRLRTAAIAVVTLLVLLLGLQNPPSAVRAQGQDTLHKVLSSHMLTVGTISGNPPWEFVKPDGELDGYDIAIAKLVAHDLGAKVNFVQTSGAGRIPALQTHKVDLVLAELDYSPARAQIVAYTQPYARPGLYFTVLSSSRYKTVSDLNQGGITLGYALGGDEAQIWPTVVPNAKLQAFTTVADALEAVRSGRIAATGEASFFVAQLNKKYPGQFRIVNPPYISAINGIAVAQGDFDWWLWLDRWVYNFVFSGADQKLWNQYMGGGSPL
jgi:polar amino acid transport system substrate-binding protein